MRIGLLGELDVRDDVGAEVVVAGAKLRALLALLALHVGRVVATDHIVDALWGADPPSGVRNGLQALASKLRRTLGSPELVVMRAGGYVLELPAEAIDVNRYERMVADGRVAAADGDAAGAAARFAEADALWRGDALADFTYEEFAAPTIARLGDLRLVVIEERIDIELRLGRHHPALVVLDALVAAHPLRERIRGLLMLALYRAGRQADALRVFQDGRRILGEELGLEPGPELRRLEVAILGHDPSLELAVDDGRSGGARPDRHSTVPASLTPLVGRDSELAELQRLLADHRLVTLVGPGGVGKTRLALEAARVASQSLADGGALVELARVGDPSGVRPAIAAALGVPDANRLTEFLADRELVVVLDNCEHVIATAAEVAEELVAHCPRLRLVATSREGLRVGGETVWLVPPLAADDAVQLFVARAHSAGAPVTSTDELLPLIAEVCRRLDGLPLAIELAAARTRAFSVAQISARLHDRFRLLTGGSRTALPRQQTLRAVVDWSYDLLFDDERRVFERLSVFPGGCDLATAEEVCADGALAADELEDVIAALVDKSLVVAVPVGDGVRFHQLQTLAHYGQEKLAERGDAARTRSAMAAHYARLCSDSTAAFTGEGQRAWLVTVDREQDNLRAALEWAVASDDAETALMIAGGASWPHWLAGTILEGKRWIDEAFACGGDARDTTGALAHAGRGLLNFLAGQPARCDADLRAALATFHDHHDVASMAFAYAFYAEIPHVQGDLDEARRRRLEVLAFYEALPEDAFSIATRAYSRATLALLDGDLDGAEPHYRAAAAGFVRSDRPVMRSMCLGMLADFDERAGRYPAAIEELEEAVRLNDSLGLQGFNGSVLSRLTWALLQTGDVSGAAAVNGRALELGRRLRNAPVLFLALTGSALVHLRGGRRDEAVEAATDALDLYRNRGPRRFGNRIDPELEIHATAAACCSVLAIVAATDGDGVRAARLLGHADQLRAGVGAPVPAFLADEIAHVGGALVASLGADAFAGAFDRGRELGLDELVDLGSRSGAGILRSGELHQRRHDGAVPDRAGDRR